MLLHEIQREPLFSGQHLELQTITFEGGKKYEVCARTGNKNAVAGFVRHIENNSIILIEQYRYPVRNKIIELIAGLTDKPGLSHEEILREEIEEESGFSHIQKLDFLAKTTSSAGMTSELNFIFDVEISGERGAQKLGESEDIQVYEIPYGEFFDFLNTQTNKGVLIDPKVCFAMMLVQQKTGNILY